MRYLLKKCTELNVCKNCADHDKSWPTHKSWQCPFENRWGGKWPDRHETITKTGDTKIMNPIIPEEPDSHTEGGNQLPGVEEDFKDLSSIID